ncbi:MAG: alpha/beta hydrolase, partial [Victivallales bacterium]|nr:alpha/beta hydrolase [Victivallales bacterium]
IPTAFFMVHGGGWRAGDRTKFTEIAAEFARRGIITASAGYRLQAQDAFQQLADIRQAYDTFAGELERLGRPVQIAVYGESAGAHLASLLAVTPPGGCGEEYTSTRKWVKPAAMILQSAPHQLAPWEDVSPSIWYTMEEIAGAPYSVDPDRFHRLSLNRHISAETPATFFAEAHFEAVFPQEAIRELAEDMRKLGVPVKLKRYVQAEHGFFHALDLPIQREFLEDIVTYLRELPKR